MGVFSFLKRSKKEPTVRAIVREYYGDNYRYFAWNYAQNIYSIPEVRTAIEAFADVFSTIPKYHERIDREGNVTYLENEVSRILTIKPNPLQNATQFWKEAITRLFLDSNVFIEPIYSTETGKLQNLYVLPSKSFEFKFESVGTAKVIFRDSNNVTQQHNLKDLIYLNRFSALSGGQKNSLGLHETVIQALMQQAVNVADPRKPKAILQGKSGQTGNLKEKDKTGTLDKVGVDFDNNVKGMAYLDSMWNVTPINWNESDVNRELLKVVVSTVYNYFGVNEKIVNGTATEIEYAQWVANKVNPLARQIEQEFTSKLFTVREVEIGNRIELDTFALSISTLTAKTAFMNVGLRAGVVNLDEAREMIGYAPIPDGYGKMWRTTADTIDITKVNEYQASQKGVNDIKSDKEVNEINGETNNV